MNELAEIIESSLHSLPEQIFAFFAPYVIPIIVGSIILGIVKFIINKSVYNYALLTGDSKRQARKKSKEAEAAIDLISIFNDFNDINKK